MPMPQQPHGRSTVLLATLAAAAVMWFGLGGCDDDSPGPATPGTGSSGGQVGVPGTGVDVTGGGGNDTVLSASTTPGATDAPNPNAAGGGAGVATSAP